LNKYFNILFSPPFKSSKTIMKKLKKYFYIFSFLFIASNLLLGYDCFFINFYVCRETNAIKCLVINQTVFYIMGPTKKLGV
jgi:hypothetical protein